MVIVKEDNLLPLQWKLGRVIEVSKGSDDKIRSVTVKTAHGEYKRPIVKICLLPIETNNYNNSGQLDTTQETEQRFQ